MIPCWSCFKFIVLIWLFYIFPCTLFAKIWWSNILTRLATPIFDQTRPKYFDQVLIFVNLYQHSKDEIVSSMCSREIVDWKILESHWLNRNVYGKDIVGTPPPLIKEGGRTFRKLSHQGGTKFFARKGG